MVCPKTGKGNIILKVLWFTNIPMPDVNTHLGKHLKGSGGWMGALLRQLKGVKNIELGVVTAYPGYPDVQFNINNVQYFLINQISSRLLPHCISPDDFPSYLTKCRQIIKEFNPDIIHIHGTERFYISLLLKDSIKCPVVISIQGILKTYCEWYRWFGKLKFSQIIRMELLHSLILKGELWGLLEARKRAVRETSAIKKNRYFFGRTDWDKAHVKSLNTDAVYLTAQEMIRSPFWARKWNIKKCKKHRIIFTNAGHPRKGTDILLDGAKILLRNFPELELILVGSAGRGGYGKYLRKKIKKLGNHVKILGLMDAEQISHELCKAHVFVSASFIDNSPNSVAEAQLVGMPVVSSYTGGIPSLIKEGETGLFFPTGEAFSMANKIADIFNNDELAFTLGKNAFLKARERHQPELIVHSVVDGYRKIIQDYASN